MKIVGSGDMGSILIIPLIIILQGQYGISLVKDTHPGNAKETKSCDHSPTWRAEEVGIKAQTGAPDCLCWKCPGGAWYLEELQWEVGKDFHSDCYWRT